MRKELSVDTCEVLFNRNRIKAKDAIDGQTIAFFHDGVLFTGDVVRCDECPNISTINGGVVDVIVVSEYDLMMLKFVHSNRLLEPEVIGCYDADGSGHVLCPECTAKRKTQSKG